MNTKPYTHKITTLNEHGETVPVKEEEKIMYLCDDTLTITGMNLKLEEFTIHNGRYPDVIEMPFNVISRYRSLLLDVSLIKDIRFRGIPIREVL